MPKKRVYVHITDNVERYMVFDCWGKFAEYVRKQNEKDVSVTIIHWTYVKSG